MIKVGILGLGYWGKKVLSEYLTLPNVEVVGVCDILQENRDYAEGLGIPTYPDHLSMLSSRPDAVHICLPNDMHEQVSVTAMNAGASVLVEKPMALDPEGAYRMLLVSNINDVTLCVGHIYRFNNALKEMKRLIGSDFFGEIYEINFKWANRENILQRNIFFDLATHYFDILNYLTGEWGKCIRSEVFRGRDDRYESARIICNCANIPSTANLNWLGHKKTREIEIIGEERSAYIDAVKQEIRVHDGSEYELKIEQNNALRDEILHFLRSMSEPVEGIQNSGPIGAMAIECVMRCL